MDDEMVGALTAMALAAITAGTSALWFMAHRGLVSPNEIDQFVDSFTAHFSSPGESAAQDFFRDVLEVRYSQQLADLRELARKNWRGGNG